MPRKKPFKYKIQDLISEHNEELYNEVSAQIEIQLQQQNDSWSANINDKGIAIIGCSKSKYADAAFAHELLHIKAEISGLKDPEVRSDEPDITWSTIRFLINQLAHHRIYPEFYDMGFLEEEFLNDNDYLQARLTLQRDIPMLENIQAKLGELLDGFAILYPYLVCISPNETSEEIKGFKNRLIKIANPNFIKEIDGIIAEWTTSNRMDYCLTLAKIFKACNKLKICFAAISDPANQFCASTV